MRRDRRRARSAAWLANVNSTIPVLSLVLLLLRPQGGERGQQEPSGSATLHTFVSPKSCLPVDTRRSSRVRSLSTLLFEMTSHPAVRVCRASRCHACMRILSKSRQQFDFYSVPCFVQLSRFAPLCALSLGNLLSLYQLSAHSLPPGHHTSHHPSLIPSASRQPSIDRDTPTLTLTIISHLEHLPTPSTPSSPYHSPLSSYSSSATFSHYPISCRSHISIPTLASSYDRETRATHCSRTSLR